jgi:hypothetical protein
MKRKVSSVRIEKAAQKNHHIVHTNYEPTPTKNGAIPSYGQDEKPHTFDNLEDTMAHVRGVLGDEEIGEGKSPDPDDMKPSQKTKHSWHS